MTSGRGDADAIVAGYLVAVAARLPGPRRTRREITAELEDGLAQAVDLHLQDRVSPIEAARAATRQFGEPREVAAAFTSELAVARARQVGLGLVGTGPFVGLLWVWALAGVPAAWPPSPIAAAARAPATAMAVVAAIATVVAAALVVVVATGRATRRIRTRPRLALQAAATASIATLTCDALVVGTVVATQVLTGSASTPVLAAMLVSLARAATSVAACRGCRSARALVPTGS